MSTVSIKRQQQVEQVTDRLVVHVQRKYPFITTEVTYDPPDNVDAWVTLHGAADAEEWDEIRHFGCEVTDPAWEQEGVLVLIHAGDYRTPVNYAPLDLAAIEAAREAYKRRQAADQVMARMVQEIQRVFPELPVDTYNGGPECEDGIVTVHIPPVENLEWEDVADSVRRLLADLPAEGLSEDRPSIWTTSELDESLSDPALLARLKRHYQLVETLGTLYPLANEWQSRLGNEIEVFYYPSDDLDALVELQGAITEVEMAQLCAAAQPLLDAARAEHGLRIELTSGPSRQ